MTNRMEQRQDRMHGVLEHAEFVIWAFRIIQQVNQHWARKHNGSTLMTKEGLFWWLYNWAVEAGLLREPGKHSWGNYSARLAPVFAKHKAAVMEAARDYWRELAEEQEE
jgi:hypothetical protein